MVSNGKRKEACPDKGPCKLNVSDSSLRTDRMQLHVHVPVTALRPLRAKPFTIIKTK